MSDRFYQGTSDLHGVVLREWGWTSNEGAVPMAKHSGTLLHKFGGNLDEDTSPHLVECVRREIRKVIRVRLERSSSHSGFLSSKAQF